AERAAMRVAQLHGLRADHVVTNQRERERAVEHQRPHQPFAERVRLIQNVLAAGHRLRPFDESSGCVTIFTAKPASPISAVTCATISQMVSLSARIYTPFDLPYRCRMAAGSSLILTAFSLSQVVPSLVIETTGISLAFSLTGRTLGTSTSIPNSITWAVSMKMISSTSTTSTNGVTLISANVVVVARRLDPNLPPPPLPPLTDNAMALLPAEAAL